MIKTLSFNEFKKLYPSHFNYLSTYYPKSYITDFETDEQYVVRLDTSTNAFEIGYPEDYFFLRE